MSPYAQEKIDFICRHINAENLDSELKGAVLDLIQEIQAGRIIEGKTQRAFCLGYAAGASNQSEYESLMDNITKGLNHSYNLYRQENLI